MTNVSQGNDGDGNDAKEKTALTNGKTALTDWPDYMMADNDGYCLITGESVYESTYENTPTLTIETMHRKLDICKGYCKECQIYKEYRAERDKEDAE